MPIESAPHHPRTAIPYKRIALACIAFAFTTAVLTPRYKALNSYAGALLQNSGKMHFQNPFKSGESSKPSSTSYGVPRPNGKVNIVYFTNWAIYGRKFRPQDIPAEHVTREQYTSFSDRSLD